MELLLLALLISGLCGASSAHSRYYYFVNESKTWSEAQSYCRANYTDLATVDNMEEMKQLIAAVDPKFSGFVWTGLYRGSPRRWGWSSGEISPYVNWNSTEPDGGDRDGLCAAMHAYSKWVDVSCTDPLEFVCYSEPTKQFIHVKEKHTWRDAQAYCRQNYTDLATVHNDQEHQNLSDLLGSTDYAWIGFFFDNWKWSDQRSSTFRYWRVGQPWSPTGTANCSTMVTTTNGQWDDELCDAKIPFMCYKAPRKRVVKLTVTSSGKNLTDPAVKAAILNKIETEFRKQAGTKNATLSWREKNGEVFHSVKNKTVEDNKCG